MDVYIISGFTGAGKTTLLNKLLPSLQGKMAVIENEMGEVKLAAELLKDADLLSELPTGCICCTLAANLKEKLWQIYEEYHVDRIFIEPSGVGRLSDVVRICKEGKEKDNDSIQKIRRITLIDISVMEDYLEDFGDFYKDQIEYADTILLSYIEDISDEEKERAIAHIHEINQEVKLYEYDWRKLSETELLELIEQNGYAGKEPDEERIIMNLSGQGIRSKRRINLWQK